LVPDSVGRPLRHQRARLDDLTPVLEHLRRDPGGFERAFVRARENQRRVDRRLLQDPPQLLPALRGEGAFGVGKAGAAVLGDAVAQQEDLHQALTLRARVVLSERCMCSREMRRCRSRKICAIGWPASITLKLYGATMESRALMSRV